MVSFRDRLAQALKVRTRIHIVENFLTPDECQALIELAGQKNYMAAEIGGPGSREVNEAIRQVEVCSLSPDEFSMEPITSLAAEVFGVTIDETDSQPQILKYESGGHYRAHCDAVNVVATPDGWRSQRVYNRDVSVVLYLNDAFEGGEFEFMHAQQVIQPRAGMLILFPSDWRHEHRVGEVTSGTRWALVNWYPTTPALVPELEDVGTSAVTYYDKKG